MANTIKDSLLSGTSPQKIYDDFVKELNSAMKETKESREKNKDDARQQLIEAIAYYLYTLGAIEEEELPDEEYARLDKFLKRPEKESNNWLVRDFFNFW